MCKRFFKCRECEARDCDKDQQCRKGLLCADAHKAELTAAGVDPRKAYCDASIGLENWELCYDPNKIPTKCNDDTDCSDRNACNGIEKCDLSSGVCQPGQVLDCNDNNLCTRDSCDSVAGCVNNPIACGVDEACDRVTGSCENTEALRPCIAVIDESDIADSEIDAKWLSFRTNFPTRPFCLLQPFNPSCTSGLYRPPSFSTDPRTIFAIVNRDNGDRALASNWLQACNYTDLALTGIDFIGLFLDESGSITRETVQASLDKFFADLNATRLTYCAVYDALEDWITPFNTLLGAQGGGGDCVVPP